MTFSSAVGLAAALLTTVAFVPQVVRVIRTRDTCAISLWMYLLFSTGVLLWLVYGIALMLWPIIIANSITMLLSSVVIVFKLREPDLAETRGVSLLVNGEKVEGEPFRMNQP